MHPCMTDDGLFFPAAPKSPVFYLLYCLLLTRASFPFIFFLRQFIVRQTWAVCLCLFIELFKACVLKIVIFNDQHLCQIIESMTSSVNGSTNSKAVHELCFLRSLIAAFSCGFTITHGIFLQSSLQTWIILQFVATRMPLTVCCEIQLSLSLRYMIGLDWAYHRRA